MKQIKFGKAFSDNVSIQKKGWQTFKFASLTGWGARLTLFHVSLVVLFFILFLRLFDLTVVRGEEHRRLADENRIKRAVIHAPRGILMDRHGNALVENIPAYRVSFLCATPPCQSTFMTQAAWNKEKKSNEQVFFEEDFLRLYTHSYETAHLLGYLTEVTEEEMHSPYYEYQRYEAGDRLGRMGLESYFEKTLRGTNGEELIEVDAQNQKVRTLGKIDAKKGHDVVLSIDSKLQQIAYTALGENPGAVVVSQAKTGQILALVSTPAFSPNAIHEGLTEAQFQTILKSPDQPFLYRAVAGVYPPGSTFKLIPAIAGLESGKITPATTFEDIGVLRINEFSFANWYFTQYGGTEGHVDLLKGLARSNDIYFYKLGETVGIATISEWGKKLGVGKKTGIELQTEAEGVMSDPAWRKKVYGTEWYLGDTYHVAIGQGDVRVTPLQVNLWTNVIASGGVLCQPTLLQETNNCQDLKIKKETIDLITEGMRRACYRGAEVAYQGTGWPLFDFSVTQETLNGASGQGVVKKIPVACKTGTAEFGDPDNKTHAWFTAFAPVPDGTGLLPKPDNETPMITGEPEIVVTVLVEKGGEGSSVAGPITKKILEEWFKR